MGKDLININNNFQTKVYSSVLLDCLQMMKTADYSAAYNNADVQNLLYKNHVMIKFLLWFKIKEKKKKKSYAWVIWLIDFCWLHDPYSSWVDFFPFIFFILSFSLHQEFEFYRIVDYYFVFMFIYASILYLAFFNNFKSINNYFFKKFNCPNY